MVRILRELKETMDGYSAVINWSEEIRNFIIRRITEHRREETLNKLWDDEVLPGSSRGKVMK